MDRKKKKTIILLAMILLLVVANGAASAWNDKSEKKKEKEAETSKIYLTDASDITADPTATEVRICRLQRWMIHGNMMKIMRFQ